MLVQAVLAAVIQCQHAGARSIEDFSLNPLIPFPVAERQTARSEELEEAAGSCEAAAPSDFITAFQPQIAGRIPKRMCL